MTVYRRPDPIPRHAASRPTGVRPLAVREDSTSLTQQVARRIFSAIDEGRFPEGAILPNEQVLAGELGVSRTSLREAITALSAKGLLEARRRRGTQVLPRAHWNMLDADLIAWSRRGPGDGIAAELWQAVTAVLPALATAAARRRSAGQLRTLATSLAATGQVADLRPARLGLLHEIARLGGNRFLFSVVSTSLDSLVRDDARAFDQMSQGIGPALATGLADAVTTGRADEAVRLLEAALAAAPTPHLAQA